MTKIRWETAPPNSPDSSVVLGYVHRPEDDKEIVRFVLTRSQLDWNWMAVDTKANSIHGGFTSLNTAINWVEDTF